MFVRHQESVHLILQKNKTKFPESSTGLPVGTLGNRKQGCPGPMMAAHVSSLWKPFPELTVFSPFLLVPHAPCSVNSCFSFKTLLSCDYWRGRFFFSFHTSNFWILVFQWAWITFIVSIIRKRMDKGKERNKNSPEPSAWLSPSRVKVSLASFQILLPQSIFTHAQLFLGTHKASPGLILSSAVTLCSLMHCSR